VSPPRRPAATLTSRRILLKQFGLVATTVPAAAVIGGLVDGLLITPNWLVTSDYAFGVPPPATAEAAVAAKNTLRILQVSDLHLNRIGRLEQSLLQSIHDSHADLIVLTGDVIDAHGSLGSLNILLREFPSQPRTLAIVGNWEHRSGVSLEALGRTYEQHGGELLINRSVEVEKNGSRLRVTGLDDLIGGVPDAASALRHEKPTSNHLLLVHCPACRDTIRLPTEHSASLLLAGHTHGGQVAPGGWALIRPRGSGRYVAGWYDDGGPPMYVSRGIGTSLLPVRIGATPELVRIDWSLETQES